jgi:hypothetical protein
VNYRKAVSEGRALVKRSEADQWRLAELTSEVLAAGRTTREWAADIGCSAQHASMLNRVWLVNQVYRESDRPTFANAYAEAKGMPVDRSERREREAISNIRKATPERRAQIISELVEEEPEAEDALRETLNTRQHQRLHERHPVVINDRSPSGRETERERRAHEVMGNLQIAAVAMTDFIGGHPTQALLNTEPAREFLNEVAAGLDVARGIQRGDVTTNPDEALAQWSGEH